MAATTEVRPDAKSATVAEIAAYYAANYADLKAVDSWLYSAKRRLGAAVKDLGPLVTPSGTVTVEGNEYDYSDPQIAVEFPGLAEHVVKATVKTIEQAERVMSLISEEVPTAELGHDIKVDGTAARSVINGGGKAAHRLLDLRRAKGSLVVKA